MKFFVLLLSLVTPGFVAEASYLYECHGAAVSAARAIDELNFGVRANRTSFEIEAELQQATRARIRVIYGQSRNRQYSVRLRKNRSASLRGDQVRVEPGCFIESIN